MFDDFFDFPVNVLAIELLPALFIVALSLWLVFRGGARRKQGEGGAWTITIGLALLLLFSSFMAGIVSRHGFHRLSPIYSEIYTAEARRAVLIPPDAVHSEIVEDYCSKNFECSLEPSEHSLRLPPELVRGVHPDLTAFFMPIVYDRVHTNLMREALAVANWDFLLAFNRFQRRFVQAVDSRSKTNLMALFDFSPPPKPRHYDPYSDYFFIPCLFCPLERESVETPSVLFRPLYPEERWLLIRTIPFSSNRLDQVFMCSAFSRAEGPRAEFPVMYDGCAFRLFAPSLWHYLPTEVSQVGGERRLSAFPRLLPDYRTEGTEALERSLLEAMRTGGGLPVLDDDDALRNELREDAALLLAAFDIRKMAIRFHPALGPELDRIRRRVHSRHRQPVPTGQPAPESHLCPTGVWLVAEAVVDSFGYQWSVASWDVVETDDGDCTLASSAFSLKGPPSPDVVGAFRAAEEMRIRVLVSDGRVRELAGGCFWTGSESFLVLEMPRSWDGNSNPLFPTAEPIDVPGAFHRLFNPEHVPEASPSRGSPVP